MIVTVKLYHLSVTSVAYFFTAVGWQYIQCHDQYTASSRIHSSTYKRITHRLAVIGCTVAQAVPASQNYTPITYKRNGSKQTYLCKAYKRSYMSTGTDDFSLCTEWHYSPSRNIRAAYSLGANVRDTYKIDQSPGHVHYQNFIRFLIRSPRSITPST